MIFNLPSSYSKTTIRTDRKIIYVSIFTYAVVITTKGINEKILKKKNSQPKHNTDGLAMKYNLNRNECYIYP